jgi:hypothetical protein
MLFLTTLFGYNFCENFKTKSYFRVLPAAPKRRKRKSAPEHMIQKAKELVQSWGKKDNLVCEGSVYISRNAFFKV